MAESDVKVRFTCAQDVVPTCETHYEQCNNFFCNDCDKFICIECAKKDHREHDWNTVGNISKQRKSDLSRKSQEIREGHLPKLTEKMAKIDSLMEQNRAHRDAELSRLETHYQNIVTSLTQVVEDRKKELSRGLETKNKTLAEIQRKLKTKAVKLQDTMDDLKKSNFLSDYNLLNVDCALNRVLPISDGEDLEDLKYSLHFKEGSLTKESVELLLGTVKDYDDFTLTKIRSFRHDKSDIICLEVDFYSNAVLVNSNQTYWDTVNTKGKLKSRNEFYSHINDFAVLPNGDIIFSENESHSIQLHTIQMSANDATRTVADTSPLTPEGVCLTSEGDILVTMADPEDENATGLVKMFSMRGKVKRKYEYDSSGERLFKLPFRVAQNKNSDICVLDSLDTEHGVLHTISSEGHTQFIYKGVKSLQHPLYAADIVCDDICNIILMDAKNHHIHLLDSAGNFLKFLTRDEGDRRHSLSLALSGDILWAGGHNGYLSVYKYTNNS